LHHFPAFRQVLGKVLGGTYGIAFAMGKLALDHVRHEAVLVEDG
jgi:hypothetical protein